MTSPRPLALQILPSFLLFAVAGLWLFGVSAEVAAQDIARPSLGGQRAANTLSPVPSSRYNVKAGPVQMLFNAAMGGEYNTNINVSEDNPISDYILRPRVGMGLYWPITKLNNLNLNLQVGYDYYISNPDYGGNTLLISPATEFIFAFYIGDFRFTLFDRPAITNNPVDNPTVTDAIDYTIFTNTGGLNVTWDLNDVLIGAGYSNFVQYAINNDFNYQNRISNQVYANASFLVQPFLRLGLEGSGTATDYTAGSSPGANALNNNWNYTIGGFALGNISRNLDYSAGVGWQFTDFSESNNPLNTGNYSRPYFYLNVDHALNRFYTHRLSTGLEGVPSSQSNWLQLYYVRYSFNWALIKDWSLGGAAFYENGVESQGPNSEDFNRLGGTISLSYQLTRNWMMSIYYGVIGKGSTVNFDSYNQQRFGLDIVYNF